MIAPASKSMNRVRSIPSSRASSDKSSEASSAALREVATSHVQKYAPLGSNYRPPARGTLHLREIRRTGESLPLQPGTVKSKAVPTRVLGQASKIAEIPERSGDRHSGSPSVELSRAVRSPTYLSVSAPLVSDSRERGSNSRHVPSPENLSITPASITRHVLPDPKPEGFFASWIRKLKHVLGMAA